MRVTRPSSRSEGEPCDERSSASLQQQTQRFVQPKQPKSRSALHDGSWRKARRRGPGTPPRTAPACSAMVVTPARSGAAIPCHRRPRRRMSCCGRTRLCRSWAAGNAWCPALRLGWGGDDLRARRSCAVVEGLFCHVKEVREEISRLRCI